MTKRGRKNVAAAQPFLFPDGPVAHLPQGVPAEIAPESLLLDPANFRLLEAISPSLRATAVELIGEPSIQEKIFATITGDSRFDIDRLVSSIAYNGFLKHEQLIVARYDGVRCLVLEGNRRLTAVRKLRRKASESPDAFAGADLKRSLRTTDTLPCFVLEGDVIGDSEETLAKHRRASEVYIGMRHLMGARPWDPAGRYEFQAKLIEEGWTPEQIEERFGRDKSQINRELKGQRLYTDFLEFERRKKLRQHQPTYNAFAEAGRSPAIMTWLGWNAKEMRVTNQEREHVFFSYLVSRLGRPASREDGTEDDDEVTTEESAEKIVRRLRDMIKLNDADVMAALHDLQFDFAEMLYENRKEGQFQKKVLGYIRNLRAATASELKENEKQNKIVLVDLMKVAETILGLLSPSSPRRR